MISEAIPSARVQPVARMMTPAIAVKMKAARSVAMCWNEPSMFIDRRFACASCQVAARVTTMPTIATTTIALPSAEGGMTRRRIAS